jgi:hypothetical protein
MSTPLTDEELAAIKVGADKATPGPWSRYGSSPFEVFQEPSGDSPDDSEYVTTGSTRQPDARKAVAA